MKANNLSNSKRISEAVKIKLELNKLNLLPSILAFRRLAD